MPKPIDHFALERMNFIQRTFLRIEFPDWMQRLIISPLANFLLPRFAFKSTLFEKYVQDMPKDVSHSGFDRDANARSAVKFVAVTGEEFAKIRRACKRRCVTVHSVLQTAGNIAASEMIYDCAKIEYPKMTAETDLGKDAIMVIPCHRKHLPDGSLYSSDKENDMVCHSYHMTQIIRLSEWKYDDVAQFWERAKEAQSQNHNRFTHHLVKSHFEIKGLNLCLGGDPENSMRYLHSKPKYALLGYTNHGDCNFLNRNDQHESAEILKVVGLVCGVIKNHSNQIINHIISSLDNKLIWNLCYDSNVMNPDLAKRYLDRCVEIVKMNCIDYRSAHPKQVYCFYTISFEEKARYLYI